MRGVAHGIIHCVERHPVESIEIQERKTVLRPPTSFGL